MFRREFVAGLATLVTGTGVAASSTDVDQSSTDADPAPAGARGPPTDADPAPTDGRGAAADASNAAAGTNTAPSPAAEQPNANRVTGEGPARSRARCPGSDEAATTAVVDRIVDGDAVVLFEDEGYQRTVPANVLPEDAREEGVVLSVPHGEALALAEVDRAETEERQQSAQDRFDDLAESL